MRALTIASAAVALAVAVAAPASAHVTVQGPGATQGGFAKLTFRVPTEKDVPTTRLEVVFPADAPIANVNVKPHAGWTYAVAKGKPATPLSDAEGNAVDSVVQRITWTATAGGIKPGEFDEFDVSGGPLPQVEQMVFKALQTYGDGSVVRWIEPRVAGGPEPDHPAPVLTLAASSETGSVAPTPSGAAAPAVTAVAAPPADDDDDEEEVTDSLGLLGVALGGLALVVALLGFVRGRRS